MCFSWPIRTGTVTLRMLCCSYAAVGGGVKRRSLQSAHRRLTLATLFVQLAHAGKEHSQGLAQYPLGDPAATLAALGETVAASTGGTSGALYDIMLTAAGAALRTGGHRAEPHRHRSPSRRVLTALSATGVVVFAGDGRESWENDYAD